MEQSLNIKDGLQLRIEQNFSQWLSQTLTEELSSFLDRITNLQRTTTNDTPSGLPKPGSITPWDHRPEDGFVSVAQTYPNLRNPYPPDYWVKQNTANLDPQSVKFYSVDYDPQLDPLSNFQLKPGETSHNVEVSIPWQYKQQQEYPDNNPKTAFGAKKLPLELVPPSAIAALAEAFADGAKKYGPYNWRDKAISSSVYYGAALRHLSAWWDGEDLAEDSGISHLYHALACIAMVVDGQSVGKLNDNRPTKGAASQMQKDWLKKFDEKQNGDKSLNPQESCGG